MCLGIGLLSDTGDSWKPSIRPLKSSPREGPWRLRAASRRIAELHRAASHRNKTTDSWMLSPLFSFLFVRTLHVRFTTSYSRLNYFLEYSRIRAAFYRVFDLLASFPALKCNIPLCESVISRGILAQICISAAKHNPSVFLHLHYLWAIFNRVLLKAIERENSFADANTPQRL